MALAEANGALDSVLDQEYLYIRVWLVHAQAVALPPQMPLITFCETIAEWMRAKVPVVLRQEFNRAWRAVAETHLKERGVCPYNADQIRCAVDQQIDGLKDA
jgi:hypothetical protein